MAWQTPKTNWSAADVPLPDDFNRIEGNTQHLKDEVDSHKAEDASTAAKGHVQLSSSTSSTSTSLAATASAVKTVKDEAKAYTDSHEQKAAPHSGHETPAGAQAKADAAEAAAKAYADQEVADLAGEGRTTETVKGNADALDAHKAEIATQESLGHVKVDGETITASNGIISAQTQIVDTVTSDKWKWGMENGIIFLEKVVV